MTHRLEFDQENLNPTVIPDHSQPTKVLLQFECYICGRSYIESKRVNHLMKYHYKARDSIVAGHKAKTEQLYICRQQTRS